MVPGGTVAPVERVDQEVKPAQPKGSIFGLPRTMTFEQLFGNVNLGMFNSE